MFWVRFRFKFRFKKLVISSKVIKEIEIISLCKLDEILSEENYFEKSFLIDVFLNSQNRSFSLRSLIDSDSVAHMLIHANLVNRVCKKLEIQSISLTKEKLIRDYDEKISKKIITHKILLNLIIESHKKLTVSMLIADINHHEVILSKLWMNKNEILLNMRNDVIVFPNQLNTSISIFSILLNSKHLSWSRSTSLSSIIQTKTSIMLKRSVSTTTKKESFSIRSIDAALFKTLLNQSKKNQTEVFALFMTDIDREITYNTQCNLNVLNVLLRAYQGWIELVSVSSSDLTQFLFSFINISLFNIIFLSTSHSTRVTNTFSLSLAQPLNIT